MVHLLLMDQHGGGEVSVFASADEYNALKNKMLSSIYENGGFWIGRYEAGSLAPRTAHYDEISSSLVPSSKKDLYPINFVTRNQAQMLASRVLKVNNITAETKETVSSLMFGLQWDLVLKHLETKIGASNLSIGGKNILTQDSTSWGNYSNDTLTITSGNAKTATAVTTGGDKGALSTWNTRSNQNNTTTGAGLLTTGAADGTSKYKIYDLAGNEWEWTLEKTSYTSSPCTIRGGGFGNGGFDHPTANRYYGYVYSSYRNGGLRVSLY